MKIYRILSLAVLMLLMASCKIPQVYYGNFDGDLNNIEGLDQSLFTVTSVKKTTIDNTKASSTNAIGFFQKVLQSASGSSVVEIAGTYTSLDHNLNPITLSGKIIVPTKVRAKRYIVISHYTIGSNAEAPSLAFPLEGILATLGYILVIPDYEGYGVTADHQHPYLVMGQSGQNVTDMYVAVERLFSKTDLRPVHDDIYLYGYSQGGATTMAALANMEALHPEIKVFGVFAGGGPYDIRATYMTFIDNNFCGYPFALPIVLQGMITGNDLDINIRDLLQPWIADKYGEWYESKKYTSAQVNSFIGTKVTSEILNKTGMNPQDPKVAELYKAMTENSIAYYKWTPKAPIYLFHSIDDDTVPYVNAVKLKQRWADANVQVNFGHYGSHVMACVRFLLAVRGYLMSGEDEQWKNQSEI